MKSFAELSASFNTLVNELKALEKTMPNETESEIKRIDSRIEELEKEKCSTVAKFEEEFGKLTEMINAMQQVVGMTNLSDSIGSNPKAEPDRDRVEKEIPAESVTPVEPENTVTTAAPCTDTPQTAVSKMKSILDDVYAESNKAFANANATSHVDFLGKVMFGDEKTETPEPVKIEQLTLPVEGPAREIKQPTHVQIDGKFITMDNSRHNMGDVIWIDWLPNIEPDRYYYYMNRVWDGKTKTPAVAKVKDGVYQVMFETVSNTFVKIKYMDLRKELVKRGAK